MLWPPGLLPWACYLTGRPQVRAVLRVVHWMMGELHMVLRLVEVVVVVWVEVKRGALHRLTCCHLARQSIRHAQCRPTTRLGFLPVSQSNTCEALSAMQLHCFLHFTTVPQSASETSDITPELNTGCFRARGVGRGPVPNLVAVHAASSMSAAPTSSVARAYCATVNIMDVTGINIKTEGPTNKNTAISPTTN